MPVPAPLSAKVRLRRPSPGNPAPPRRKIKKASRGRKRQRSGGSYRDLHKPRRNTEVAGDWLDPDVRATELEPVPTQSPISDHAKDLLTEFLRRESFWCGVKEDGLPVGFAGAAYLFVKQRQAYKVLDELEEAEGPWPWFRTKAAEALASGKIGGGKSTRGCPIADCFFTELAGGMALLDNLKVIAFGGRRKVPVKEARQRVSSIGGEIIDYLVYGHINAP